MARELGGRVVAVAGAAGSLGPALCARLVAEGAVVALAGRDAARLSGLAVDLGVGEEGVDVAAVDLAVAGEAQAWASSLLERFGRVDAVCHLVGGWRGGTPLPDADVEEDWAALEGPLVTSVRHCVRAFEAPLRAATAGRFVLASSVQAAAPTGVNAAYSVAKAAGEAWVLALADSWSAEAATANVVAVNALVTPAMREAAPERAFRSFADVDDVAAAFAWLLSDAAAKVNGQRVVLA